MENLRKHQLWPLYLFVIFYIIISVMGWLIVTYKLNTCFANYFILARTISLILVSIVVIIVTMLLNLTNIKIYNEKLGTSILLLLVVLATIGNTYGLFSMLFDNMLIKYDPNCMNSINVCGKVVSLCNK